MRTRIAIGKKTAWWNRRLKGWWRPWGTVIGFAIAILITSQFARWIAIVMLALGCLFAIAFRLVRHKDEI